MRVIESGPCTRSFLQLRFDLTWSATPDIYRGEADKIAKKIFGSRPVNRLLNEPCGWSGIWYLPNGRRLLVVGEDALTTDGDFLYAVLA